MAFDDHLDFFNTQLAGGLGEDAIYKSEAAPDFSLKIIRYGTALLEGTPDGTNAVVWAKLSDFPVPPRGGDQIVVRGTPYTVWQPEIDLHGGVYLKLRQ